MTQKHPLTIQGIHPYEKNAKEHPDKQLLQLANIVKEVGWRQPVVVNQRGTIIVGHGRYFAFQKFSEKLGLPPLWIIDDKGNAIHGAPETKAMTPEQERTYRLADNKLNESKWDMDLVLEDLKLLSLPMVGLTGFNSNILLETEEDKPNLSAVGTPKSIMGDVYELGRHKLVCGDSTDPATYRKLLGDERARMIFTDPPYSVDYHDEKSSTIMNDNMTPGNALDFYRKVLTCLYGVTTDDATTYWWYASSKADINIQAVRETGYHFSQIVLWLKNSMVYSPGQLYHRVYEPCMVFWKDGKTHYMDRTFASFTELWNLEKKTFAEHLDVWYQKRDNTNTYIHPTQKPVQLAERAIKRSSEKNDIVLDAFGGSGSTLIACEQLERSARLIELDPKYVDAIVGRWCEFSENTHVVKNGESVVW